jgi:hypothetical protein
MQRQRIIKLEIIAAAPQLLILSIAGRARSTHDLIAIREHTVDATSKHLCS